MFVEIRASVVARKDFRVGKLAKCSSRQEARNCGCGRFAGGLARLGGWIGPRGIRVREAKGSRKRRERVAAARLPARRWAGPERGPASEASGGRAKGQGRGRHGIAAPGHTGLVQDVTGAGGGPRPAAAGTTPDPSAWGSQRGRRGAADRGREAGTVRRPGVVAGIRVVRCGVRRSRRLVASRPERLAQSELASVARDPEEGGNLMQCRVKQSARGLGSLWRGALLYPALHQPLWGAKRLPNGWRGAGEPATRTVR